MRIQQLVLSSLSAMAFACIALLTSPAHADNIAWTTWNSYTSNGSAAGSASGTIGSITVTYSGQIDTIADGVEWTPATSFQGGSVGNAPPTTTNPAVDMVGGSSALTETVTFSSPIVDPVFSIWSLGASGTPASFDFTDSEPFALVAGGPSTQFGGSTITKSGDDVLGSEGNGTIIFDGTFSTISFTTPTYEGFYAFTVGFDQTLTDAPPSATPEPGTLAMLGTGLVALAGIRRKLVSRG